MIVSNIPSLESDSSKLSKEYFFNVGKLGQQNKIVMIDNIIKIPEFYTFIKKIIFH